MLTLRRFFAKFFYSKKAWEEYKWGVRKEITTKGKNEGWFKEDGDFNFDAIEKSVLDESVGFGNPDSKWSVHEQFLLWKKMIQSGRFQSRDEYCNILVRYSTYQQALKALSL